MSAPELASDRNQLTQALGRARTSAERRVVLVPTMGALHDGHAHLMRRARERAGAAGLVVASVFVNPLQFGAEEDLARYPRTLEADLKLAEREGVDVVFAPAVELMYPTWPVLPRVTLDPGPLGDVLEGQVRPGHFGGMLTVVAKLFGLTRPDEAVFGEKDYQQLVLVRALATELFPGLTIVGAETQREPDGLALSSRNRFLDPDQRRDAVALNRALRAAQAAGEYGVDAALAAAHAELRPVAQAGGLDLDYLVITGSDLEDLPVEVAPGTLGRVLVAARLGATRLIDNLPIEIAPRRNLPR